MFILKIESGRNAGLLIIKQDMMKTIRTFILFAVASIVTANTVLAKQPKYVFYMIGDGMGVNEVYGTQIYNQATGLGPATLNFTRFPVLTLITTHSATSLVTDSAAGGTALSTGVKTYNDAMGVDIEKNPLSNIAEWAKAKGAGTGVATSVGVNHATPAAFYAHTASRNEYEKIAMQLIESDLDFAAGAGFLNQARWTGHDSAYLEKQAADAGIDILRGEDLRDVASHKGRVICLSSDPGETELKYAIDRRPGDTELCDFVQAGIDYLYSKFAKKGFFFMIEGGKIDYAGHNNDAAANFQEVNDFADAVDLVLAFYEKHPDETLIVITADHETGGLSLGAGQYQMNPARLAVQKRSEVDLNAMFKEFVGAGDRKAIPSWDQMKGWLKDNLGLWSEIMVDPKTERDLWESYEKSVRPGASQVITLYSVSTQVVSDAIEYVDRQASFTWTQGEHSGSPVGLYVKGAGSDEFLGCHDNTQIPVTIARLAGYRKNDR